LHSFERPRPQPISFSSLPPQNQPFPEYTTAFPTLLCLSACTLYFLFQLGVTLAAMARVLLARRGRTRPASRLSEELLRAMKKPQHDFSFYRARVKELLVNPKVKSVHQRRSFLARLGQQAWAAVSARMYHSVSYFRYSPRIVAMATVSLFLLFEVWF
jgi:hypothetical protein